MTPNPPIPARRAERQDLADAHLARAAAEHDLEEACRILARGHDLVDEATHRLDVARTESSAATELRARQLAQAAATGAEPPTSATGQARGRELAAEDELAAAKAALDGLQANVTKAEAALRHAENMAIACTDAVIRSVAKPVLAEAIAAADTLQRCRILLHFLDRPQAGGTVPYMGIQRGVFGEEGDREAERIRDQGFTGETEAAIRRHIEFALGSIRKAEQQWSLDPQLTPWVALRNALLAGEVDCPLPQV
jgi:hypothetical protein